MRTSWRQASLIALLGLVCGALYRYGFDAPHEATLANYVRSGLHGAGLSTVGWATHLGLMHWSRRVRLPIIAELGAKSLIMAIALASTAVALQLILYADLPDRTWVFATLPKIVGFAFAASLVFNSLFELSRFVGGRVLANVIAGRYYRPLREERVFMFLDLVGSTRLAEKLGEARVHDLITRLFLEIDDPIVTHGGEVHAYVGDQVVVTWPLDAALHQARCVTCFFAIEDKIARSAPSYEREFGVVPRFSASLHAGSVIVSECGDSKRQIAYFGDTMNVTARMQEEGKLRGASLVASADVINRVTLPSELEAQTYGEVRLRGREAPIELIAVRRTAARKQF